MVTFAADLWGGKDSDGVIIERYGILDRTEKRDNAMVN